MFMLYTMIDNPQDMSKFDEIYTRYRNTLYAVAITISKNPHDAEDIVQDSAVKIIHILHRIDPEDIPKPKCKNLAITIAKNTAIDYLRKKKHETINSDIPLLEVRDKSAEDAYFEAMDYKKLVECIKGLNDSYQEVLRLRCLFHLSSRETAELLNTTEANINTRYMRAKKQLALKIEELKHG